MQRLRPHRLVDARLNAENLRDHNMSHTQASHGMLNGFGALHVTTGLKQSNGSLDPHVPVEGSPLWPSRPQP